MENALLVLHGVATWTMVGVIWIIQRVHYPIFDRIDREGYRRSMAFHTGAIGGIVAPTMVVEAAAAAGLVVIAGTTAQNAVAWIGVGLVGVIWISTALLQVPRHRTLALGFDERAYTELVATNWIRTVAWSLRGLLAAWWLLTAGRLNASVTLLP